MLKVLLLCDTALWIDRIVNCDNITAEEAKGHLRERESANFGNWKKMYQTNDFWDPKHYDLVIDTHSHEPKETLDVVLQTSGYFEHGKLTGNIY